MTAAPPAIGPYRPVVPVPPGAPLLFTSGQIGLDPGTGRLVEGGAAAQADRAIENLRLVLEAAGSSLAHVVRTTLYLRSMADFEAVNAVYAGRFGAAPPARACVAAADLPRGALVEIDAIAVGGTGA